MTRIPARSFAVALCLLAGAAALALSARGGGDRSGARGGTGELKAFQRPARAGDAIPRSAVGVVPKRFGAIVASRRIATASGSRGHAALYLTRTSRNEICLIQVERRAAGGGCSLARDYFSAQRLIAAGTGDGFFHGVAANEVARVAFADPHGALHPVHLTRDGGFIYVCRARNGCIDVIKAVNGYDSRGHLISHERW